ncbi:hypothetical protein MUK42_05892 [Musa troglodytarum]|uniref:Uncharacterized protein n=1 Tax=Musa troglodytarum TaxID=320322 RepID=A0A9E7GRS3_9LILI|nr:hypothetical protein MUK42_05892 [Musa troglodytarum]
MAKPKGGIKEEIGAYGQWFDSIPRPPDQERYDTNTETDTIKSRKHGKRWQQLESLAKAGLNQRRPAGRARSGEDLTYSRCRPDPTSSSVLCDRGLGFGFDSGSVARLDQPAAW